MALAAAGRSEQQDVSAFVEVGVTCDHRRDPRFRDHRHGFESKRSQRLSGQGLPSARCRSIRRRSRSASSCSAIAARKRPASSRADDNDRLRLSAKPSPRRSGGEKRIQHGPPQPSLPAIRAPSSPSSLARCPTDARTVDTPSTEPLNKSTKVVLSRTTLPKEVPADLIM